MRLISNMHLISNSQLRLLTHVYGSQKESQKIDDLPVLATCQSGTTAMLSSKVDGHIAYGSTRQCLIWLRPLTNLKQAFRACHLCTFNVAAIFGGVISTYGVLPYICHDTGTVSSTSIHIVAHLPFDVQSSHNQLKKKHFFWFDTLRKNTDRCI